MPDGAEFDGDDRGANTLSNTSAAVGGLSLPHLGRWGLGNITEVKGTPPHPSPVASWGRLALAAPNKDTVSGHWEMMGHVLDRRLPVFPNGFSEDLLMRIAREAGAPDEGWLGNKSASGTEILAEFGPRHLETRSPIVYTSADSVFQAAAHEEAYGLGAASGLDRLLRYCEAARRVLVGPDEVARVIARPFLGSPGAFLRTANRTDYAIAPAENLIDRFAAAGIEVRGIGKISDLFIGRGIARSEKTKNNADGIAKTIRSLERDGAGFVFVNLVDFDSQYGHRNDPKGYANALREFDAALPEIERNIRPDDLVLLASDHGNDPTTPSTEHNREYCMLLARFGTASRGGDLGTRASLADLGATVAEHLGVAPIAGESFLTRLARPATALPARG